MSIKFENRKAMRAFADTLQEVDDPQFVRDIHQLYEEKVLSFWGEYDEFGITEKDIKNIARNYAFNKKRK